MSHKGDTSTQSRMTFYSELSNLRRSALIKYEENENLTAIKDSYRVYIIGPESSDKHELIRYLYVHAGRSTAQCTISSNLWRGRRRTLSPRLFN